jgi:hypothetical protein
MDEMKRIHPAGASLFEWCLEVIKYLNETSNKHILKLYFLNPK